MGGGWFLVSGRGCAGRERVDEEGRERKTGHGDEGREQDLVEGSGLGCRVSRKRERRRTKKGRGGGL